MPANHGFVSKAHAFIPNDINEFTVTRMPVLVLVKCE